MHYPAYTIVIYQHLQVLNDVRSAIFDRKGKKDGYQTILIGWQVCSE